MAAGDLYSDENFPWNFYFNGVVMPKWGAQWWLPDHALDKRRWDGDIGHRDLWLIRSRLSHVGVVESAEGPVFLYAVQKALGILLENEEEVMASIRASSYPAEEVYHGVVSAAFEMRRLTEMMKVSFWTTGYEPDRLCLVERMERAALSPDDPRYQPAPHVLSYARSLQSMHNIQRKKLHLLAQSGRFNKAWRKQLNEL